MNRSKNLEALTGTYDICVIGGGATGLGTAVDSVSRGYRTVLVEAHDFSQATSSRSTKLIHGGVRYLERGDIKLVREALRERGLLLRNAPHVVHELRFLVPVYRWWHTGYYGAGLSAYDFLAGSLGISRTRFVQARNAAALVPTLQTNGLRAALVYSDAQFNDSRLAIGLARTADQLGGVLVNHFEVEQLLKMDGRISGIAAVDQVSGRRYEVEARVVINATGIFSDTIRRLDDPDAEGIIAFSQGTHIVLDRSFLPADTAILVPRTSDKRVVFIIPWEGRTLVGTTDIPVDHPELEPVPMEEEIEYLLEYAAMYLTHAPLRSDVLAAFAGLRPLVRGSANTTAALSRDHTLLVSSSGLVTIAGGKWTTYRLMAQDTVDRGAAVAELPPRPCVTQNLALYGAQSSHSRWMELGAYDDEIAEYESRYPGDLHSRLPYTLAMAAYVIDNEMPVNLDDVLARRLRALFLDAPASVEAAPAVARLMADLQGHPIEWVTPQLEAFRRLATRYGFRPARIESTV